MPQNRRITRLRGATLAPDHRVRASDRATAEDEEAMMPRYPRPPRYRTVLPPGAILDHATLHVARGGIYRGIGKRLLDLTFAALLLPVMLPLLAAASLWLVAQGRRPLVRRRYVGRRGRSFQVLELNLKGTAPLEIWLHRSRLDLAPRLWAVACGQMSLIGPRPVAAGQHAQSAPVLDAIRPGLLPSDPDGSLEAALVYARDLSLGRDLQLLRQALTPPAGTRAAPECA